MRKRKLFTSVLAVGSAAGLLFIGCAKDMNAEDYKEQVLKRDTAKLKLAEGKYTGNLKSLRNGANLGAIEMELRVDTKPQGDSSDSSRAAGKPVLKLFLTLQGALSATVTATDSYYDPATGNFTAAIVVKRQAAVAGLPAPQDAVIGIGGTIGADGSFKGSMDAIEGNVEYKEDGASFVLQRGGPSLEQINKASTPDPSVYFTQANHAGHAKFLAVSGQDEKGQPIVKPVNLVLLKPTRTLPDQEFVELLLPTKPLIATLNFSDSMKVEFSNALLDRRTGILKGDVVVQSSPASGSRYYGTLSMRCEPIERAPGFNCKIRTSGAPDDVASILVAPRHGPMEPPRDGLKSPPRVYLYKGKGEFPSIRSKKKVTENITLMITYDGKTLDEEIWDMIFPTVDKTLQVSFGFTDLPPTGGNPNWGNARFTLPLSSLVAKGPGIVPGSWMSLSCEGFTFQSPQKPYNFKCIYINSVNNVPCPLEFIKSR